MMWSAVILILCVIHSHSAINPPCPKIKQTGKCLGLPKTDKCQADSECGHDSMCCPTECGTECTVKRKWGLCPTFTDSPASVCALVRIGFQCGGNDADCAGTKKCCPYRCGSRQCKEPATANTRFVYKRLIGDARINKKGLIKNEVVEHWEPIIRYKKPRPECPSRFPQNKAAACHLHQCSHDIECTPGQICCDVTCGIGCTEPN